MQPKLKVGLILTVLALAMALPSRLAHAQRLGPSPSVELTYAYTHSNAPVGGCGCFGLNGGGAAFVLPLRSSPLSLIGRFDATFTNSIGAAGYDMKLLTYTGGARYSPRLTLVALHPYAEVQAGGAHLSGSYATASGLGSAFTGSAGGGLDLQLHHRFSVKIIQADYLVTTFANGTNHHQNDLRLSAGLVFSLHR